MGGGHLRKCLQGKRLTEKVTFEKTLGGTEGMNQAVFQERTIWSRSMQGQQQVQRPCGRCVSGMSNASIRKPG